MRMLRLSIIIPFYNVEHYIAQCLDSVFRQDIPEDEYEVICVDDCSPDGSLAIVESYARQHKNIRIVKNQINRKLGGARNAGLEVASGRYVMYIDSDDLLEDNMLDTICSVAESNNLDVLHFDYENYPQRTVLRKIPDTEVKTGPELFFDAHFIWYHDFITAWRKLYRREFLLNNNIAFAEHIMFEDNDYAVLVFANAERAKHIQLNVYDYRNNPESITRTSYTAQHIAYWVDLCHRMNEIRKRFREEGKDFRFHTLLEGFIRNGISNIMGKYSLLPQEEQDVAKRCICKGLDKSMKPYMSKRLYYKIKLGIIR